MSPKLGKIIRMLASDKDHEVLAAVRALRRTLTSKGDDFHTLAAKVDFAADRSFTSPNESGARTRPPEEKKY